MKRSGVDVDYQPQPDAGHNTAWWPQVKDTFEAFVRDHPRRPLPDRLTWEAGNSVEHHRAHWLAIDRLGAQKDDAKALDDVNDMPVPPSPDFGVRSNGTRINRVTPAAQMKLLRALRSDLARYNMTFMDIFPVAGVDQGGAHDRQRAPFFESAGGGEELFGDIHGLDVDAAAHGAAGVADPLVERAGKPRDRVEQHENVFTHFGEALAALDRELSDLGVKVGARAQPVLAGIGVDVEIADEQRRADVEAERGQERAKPLARDHGARMRRSR